MDESKNKVVDLEDHINKYIKERDFLRSVINLIPAFISIKNEDGCFELVNKALSEAYGTSVSDLEGKRDADFSATDEEVNNFRKKDLQAIQNKEIVIIEEEQLTRADGKVLWLTTKKVPIIDADGGCHSILVVSNDITDRKELEQRLRRYAYYDDHTAILNKYGFKEFVEPEIIKLHSKACLVIVEVRHLNAIHSVYGIEFGDRILKEIGKVFLNRNDDNIYGRIASDKFGIWMHEGDIDQIRILAGQLKHSLDIFIEQEERYHQIEFAIGYTQDMGKDESFDQLIQQVNATIEYGKKENVADILCFEEGIYEKLERNELLKSYVRKAISEDELTLYYQEKVDAYTQKVVGVEALARWFSTKLGYVSPIEFIPVFSQSKLIFDFTLWSLEKALQDYPRLQEKYHPDIIVSVNISPLVIHTDEFYSRLIRLVKKYQINPQNLMLEITEDVFLNDLELIIDKISLIRSLGIRISMDDFGSGYASLNHLINLPFDEVKIDKSIIDLMDTTVGKIFIENIIVITKELGAQVVAEGVEYKEQSDILKQLQCDYLQGYYYSKPKPID